MILVTFGCLELRPAWGESRDERDRKASERAKYDKARTQAETQADEEPVTSPSSSSSSSSSSGSLLDTQEEDGNPHDYVPDTPARISLSQQSNDSKEEKLEVVSTPPSNQKKTPPPPNRPPTPTAPIAPGSSGKNVNGDGKPLITNKLLRRSSSGQTPPSSQKHTTVRPLNKPSPVTADQYALQLRVRSPDHQDENIFNEEFKDKVENARLNAQGYPVPNGRVSPTLAKTHTDRVSPTQSKSTSQSQKRKEPEKSK